MAYAKGTDVTTETSRHDIERLLMRHGAEEFASGWKAASAMMQFKIRGRVIRFLLPLPKREDFVRTPVRNCLRSEEEQFKAWEQACRERWRALLLCIKAKLESVEQGIEQFDSAFMAQIVMPNSQTVEEISVPLIQRAYASGVMPPLLLEY